MVLTKNTNTHVWQWLQFIALRINLPVIGVLDTRPVRVGNLMWSRVVSSIPGQRLLLLQRRSNGTTDAKRNKQ